VKYPKFLSDFNDKKNICRQIFEHQVTILMKISPVGVELSHADGGADEGRS